MQAVSLIEPLEDRIAPAGVVVAPNHKSASYTDSAGDTILVTTTKGAFATSQFTFDPSNSGQLTMLSLTGNKSFNGAAITFSVTPVAGGQNTVNVGYINAINLSLASVTIPGDLARIDVGGGSSSKALGTLNVNSLGTLSTTQNGVIDTNLIAATESNITGTVGKINISGNMDGLINAQNFNNKVGTGNIGQLNIGGSIDGNSGVTGGGAGIVQFTGTLGSAVIGGGIEGGAYYETAVSSEPVGFGSIAGDLASGSKIGSIVVKGSVPDDPNPSPIPNLVGTSILGGAGSLTGSITAVNIGSVTIAGDIYGGTGASSGSVQAGANLGSMTLGGSLIGGNFASGSPTEANSAGLIFAGTSIGSLTIGKSIYGGSGIESGEVSSRGVIQKMTVMGDLVGGSAGSSSAYGEAGAIRGHVLGNIVVKGSVLGGNLVNGDSNQLGTFGGFIASDTTINGVTIGHNVVGGSGESSAYITAIKGAIKTLSIGTLDTTSGASADSSVVGGAGTDSGEVYIAGAIGNVSLTHGIAGGSGLRSGILESTGSIGSALIGGSITGGGGSASGELIVEGLLKSANIMGSLVGGGGTFSGELDASAGATTINITGAISGGTASHTGLLSVNGSASKIVVGDSVVGGGGSTSGLISVNGGINSLTIGAGVADSFVVRGGTGDNSGTVTAIGLIKTANIKGGIEGSDSSSQLVTNTGYIQADGIGTMVVGGVLKSGTASGTGTLDTSGAIRSTTTIGSLTIGGLEGNASNPAIISAVGVANLAANAKTDVAIGSITVKGSTNYGDILAGYNTDTKNGTAPLGTGVNADAQIGTVTIDGQLTATNIIAGVAPGTNGYFGNSGSAALSGTGVSDLPSIISKISRIVIADNVAAPANMTNEIFGIAAQYVAAAIVNGTAVKLTAGPDNDTFAGNVDQQLGNPATSQVYIYEV